MRPMKRWPTEEFMVFSHVGLLHLRPLHSCTHTDVWGPCVVNVGCKAVWLAGRVTHFGLSRVQVILCGCCWEQQEYRGTLFAGRLLVAHPHTNTPATTHSPHAQTAPCGSSPHEKKYKIGQRGEKRGEGNICHCTTKKNKTLCFFRSHFISFNGNWKALRPCDSWLVLQRFFQEPLIVKRVNHRVQTHPEGFRRRPTDDCGHGFITWLACWSCPFCV